MVARDILLAETHRRALPRRAHLHPQRSLDMVADAKARGLPVTGEVTPHHMALARRGHGALRQQLQDEAAAAHARDVAALIEGIVSGAVDAIATDHAPHPGSEKMQEFEQCPFGIIGLETALAVALETLVHSGRIAAGAPDRVVHHRSGARPGPESRPLDLPARPADVTIFDPELVWTYDVNRSFSKSRNSPFDGRTFRGGPVATVVNGDRVAGGSESGIA